MQAKTEAEGVDVSEVGNGDAADVEDNNMEGDDMPIYNNPSVPLQPNITLTYDSLRW